jgi:aspartyl-tRNA(Asn)/glutamyl-tRNA(Gln) amidotransferase subunit C
MGRYDTLYDVVLPPRAVANGRISRSGGPPFRACRRPRRPSRSRPMISHDDVRRIADLARIEVTAEEVDAVHGKLAAIFGLIDELAAVDTTGIEPMAHVLDAVLPLREDTVTESDRHVLYQSVAPAVEDGLYLVPKVIE